MLKKFLEGLAFGAGFALSFAIIVGLSASFFVGRGIESGTTVHYSSSGGPPFASETTAESPPFHELPIEKRIERASAIAIGRYEPAADGKQKAVLKEFLKQDAGVTIYYKVGDEVPDLSYYPREGEGRGDGIVILFEGSPATIRESMTYSGDRIRALGDMPMELFRKECSDAR